MANDRRFFGVLVLVVLLFSSFLVGPAWGRMLRMADRERLRQQQQEEELLHKHSTRDNSASPTQPGENGVNHLVSNLPGAPVYTNRHWAGHISVNNTSLRLVHLFYWLFESQSIPSEEAPLIIWMNGGPFCSSFDGALLEYLSPFVFDSDDCEHLTLNRNSWNLKANILFLDQPVGTGFSYGAPLYSTGGLDDGLIMAAQQFRAFLQRFLYYYPAYVDRPVYVFGESYAGQYIPFYLDYLLQNPLDGLNVVGAGIGNGWIDAGIQFANMPEFGLNSGLLSASEARGLAKSFVTSGCKGEIESAQKKGRAPSSLFCDAYDRKVYDSSGPYPNQVIPYDMRLYGDPETYPKPQQSCLGAYLNRADVKQALHADGFGDAWKECKTHRQTGLEERALVCSSRKQLLDVLRGGIRVLLYSGQYDIICNHAGTSAIIDSITKEEIDWIENFQTSKPYVWQTDKANSGYVQAFNNLTFILFLGGGHMCPMDRPRAGRDMVERFVAQQSYRNIPRNLNNEPPAPVVQCPIEATKTPTPMSTSLSSEPESTPTPVKAKTPKPTPTDGDDDGDSDDKDPPACESHANHPAFLAIVGVLSFVAGAALMGFGMGIKHKRALAQLNFEKMDRETEPNIAIN